MKLPLAGAGLGADEGGGKQFTLPPNQGRFLSRDPIGYNGGINLYAYTGNNPANGADPAGLDLAGTCRGGYDVPTHAHSVGVRAAIRRR